MHWVTFFSFREISFLIFFRSRIESIDIPLLLDESFCFLLSNGFLKFRYQGYVRRDAHFGE